jgi:hypothetical protein
MIRVMKREPCVWVVGRLDTWIGELLMQTELDLRHAAAWPDFEAAGGVPDALVVTPDQQDAPGFARVIERYARVPLVMLDSEDVPPTFDADDRSLIAHPRHVDAILAFLSAQLALPLEHEPPRRCRLPALVRAHDVSFVGRLVAVSEGGATVTVPGLRMGMFEVEVALLTSEPCIRFAARVERHLRADGETHLGLVWRDLDREAVRRLLRTLEREAAAGPSFSTDELPPGLLPDPQGQAEEALPDWVERALAGLASAGGWGERVLRGRLETAIQLSSPVTPRELLLPTGDL